MPTTTDEEDIDWQKVWSALLKRAAAQRWYYPYTHPENRALTTGEISYLVFEELRKLAGFDDLSLIISLYRTPDEVLHD